MQMRSAHGTTAPHTYRMARRLHGQRALLCWRAAHMRSGRLMAALQMHSMSRRLLAQRARVCKQVAYMRSVQLMAAPRRCSMACRLPAQRSLLKKQVMPARSHLILTETFTHPKAGRWLAQRMPRRKQGMQKRPACRMPAARTYRRSPAQRVPRGRQATTMSSALPTTATRMCYWALRIPMRSALPTTAMRMCYWARRLPVVVATSAASIPSWPVRPIRGTARNIRCIVGRADSTRVSRARRTHGIAGEIQTAVRSVATTCSSMARLTLHSAPTALWRAAVVSAPLARSAVRISSSSAAMLTCGIAARIRSIVGRAASTPSSKVRHMRGIAGGTRAFPKRTTSTQRRPEGQRRAPRSWAQGSWWAVRSVASLGWGSISRPMRGIARNIRNIAGRAGSTRNSTMARRMRGIAG
mmetsp:Transcript_116634/g.371004  ORF Transcript_116634/g.371004 Transcript_116634/m.371004 type:complete len:412 (+) Transcript_116634:233-1468(+)